MRRGISTLLVILIVGVTAAVIVMAYGMVNLIISDREAERENEEFDSLENLDTFSLQRFKNEFDSSAMLGKYRLGNGNAILEISDNILNIAIEHNSLKYRNKMVVNGDVLEMEYFNNTVQDDITLEILDMVYYLEFGDLASISDYLKNYNVELINLENVGLEIKDNKIFMKLNAKLNLIDIEKEYITVNDAKKVQDKLLSDGLASFGNENVMAVKTGYADKIIISVAQYNKLSELAYDSIINILAVTLNYNELYEEFIYNHSYLNLKDEEKEKYKIELNPRKQEYEQRYLGDKEMIRITIFK